MEIISLRLCSKNNCWQIDRKRVSTDVPSIDIIASTICIFIATISAFIIITQSEYYHRHCHQYNCWYLVDNFHSRYLDRIRYFYYFYHPYSNSYSTNTKFLTVSNSYFIVINIVYSEQFQFLLISPAECDVLSDQYL